MSPVIQSGMQFFLPSVSWPPSNVWGSSRSPAVSFRKSAMLGCVKSCTAATEIVYRVLPEAVEVVTVYHGARLLRL